MVGSDTYHRQVRPTQTVLPVLMPNDTKIASDWKLFEQIERTNAVTFRGDSRDPKAIIRVFKGFGPPNSRTDAYYLENNVYEAFKWYLNQRYKRDLTQKEFLNALREAAPTMKQQSLLVDYMMWRKITDKEAVHLGRMVENECLKGYISTARAIDTSLEFATREGDNFHAREGWLYLTVVHGAFVVPPGAHLYWGSQEAEIAQWGAIPAARVVGFRHVTKQEIPDGHIFIRRSFRMLEPKVSDYMMAVMSGWIPS